MLCGLCVPKLALCQADTLPKRRALLYIMKILDNCAECGIVLNANELQLHLDNFHERESLNSYAGCSLEIRLNGGQIWDDKRRT